MTDKQTPQFTFSFTPSSFEQKEPKEPADDGKEVDGATLEKEQPTGDFQPIVTLPEINVATLEQKQECIWKQRAKLYRFVGQEWKERGIGDVKFLKDPDTGKVRLLLRQEKTLKVAMNHLVPHPDVPLKSAPSSDASWAWTAYDWADADEATPAKLETFTIRFKTAEQAQEFKTHFLASQKTNAGQPAAAAPAVAKAPAAAPAPAPAAAAPAAPKKEEPKPAPAPAPVAAAAPVEKADKKEKKEKKEGGEEKPKKEKKEKKEGGAEEPKKEKKEKPAEGEKKEGEPKKEKKEKKEGEEKPKKEKKEKKEEAPAAAAPQELLYSPASPPYALLALLQECASPALPSRPLPTVRPACGEEAPAKIDVLALVSDYWVAELFNPEVQGWCDYVRALSASAEDVVAGHVSGHLNDLLSTRSFLVGDRLTLADVVVWGFLKGHPACRWPRWVRDDIRRMPHTLRWFMHIEKLFPSVSLL